jgi:hypothetical protein
MYEIQWLNFMPLSQRAFHLSMTLALPILSRIVVQDVMMLGNARGGNMVAWEPRGQADK